MDYFEIRQQFRFPITSTEKWVVFLYSVQSSETEINSEIGIFWHEIADVPATGWSAESAESWRSVSRRRY